MSVRYYKTTNETHLKAMLEYRAQKDLLAIKSEAFENAFNGGLLYSNDHFSFSIAGLYFEEPMDPKFWTKPDANRMQRPRLSLKKGTIEEKDELKKLNTKFNELKPKEEVSTKAFFDSLGIDAFDAALKGFGFFLFENTVYIKTGLEMRNLEEIVASSYLDKLNECYI